MARQAIEVDNLPGVASLVWVAGIVGVLVAGSRLVTDKVRAWPSFVAFFGRL
jgi:hypothetical protein